MLTFRHISNDGHVSIGEEFQSQPPLNALRGGVSFLGQDDPGTDEEEVSGGNPLGDVGRGGRVPPETPATLGMLLAQDLLLTFALLLRAQVAVLLLQEPHRRPALLLKVLLVFWRHGLHVFGKLAADAVVIGADVMEAPS